jgi:hypothetical protein
MTPADQLAALIESTMTPAQLDTLRAHIMAGAPDLSEYLRSKSARKLVRLVAMDYLHFLNDND